MILAIAANPGQKLALEQKGFKESVERRWVSNSYELYMQTTADALIDCLFMESSIPESGKPLLIHSPIHTLEELKAPEKTARFCAWNSFTERNLWDIAIQQESNPALIGALMETLGWQYQLVKDVPGLIAPRVISMIINEAFYALAAGISTREDINTAMKLGTNYPFGPFEWAEIIGMKNINSLLENLSKTDERYLPSELMNPDI